MKTMIEPRKTALAKALAILVIVAVVGAMVGCGPAVMYNLTIESAMGGVVIVPGEDTLEYRAGTIVALEAVPDEGHRFVKWTGDVDTIADVDAASTTITMNSDYSVTANFVAVYDLSISSTDGGSVTMPGEGAFMYDADSVVQLAAEALEGYRFLNWTGDVDTIADVDAASTTITLEGDYSIAASFVAQYVLTIDTTEGGEVASPGKGAFVYDEGTVVDLVVEADPGYRFIIWMGDVNTIDDVYAYETTIIMDSSYEISARFFDGPPPIPHNFYGSILVNGLPAPVGTEVEARGKGVRTGTQRNPITVTDEGEYLLVVRRDIDDSTEIEFYVDGHRADQTAMWQSGAETELDLTVETSAITFSLIASGTPGGDMTAPGGGTFP